MNVRNKKILFSKLKPWRDTEIVGYLTAVEIKYLFKLGCQSSSYCNKEYCNELIAKGIGGGRWFYGIPNKDLMSQIRERNPGWNRHERS